MSTLYEAGDDITLNLTVTPEGGVPTDGTTTAVVTARCDDGTVVTPTAIPNGDRSAWHATLPAARAGEWRILWTVTGTGSGVQSYELLVAAVAPAAGRSYATVGELSGYTGEAPPSGASRLLRVASRRVERATRTAIYSTDVDGYPTDPTLREAFREATCAQVAWWGETGDDTGSGAAMLLAGMQIGDVKLGGMVGSTDAHPVAPAAQEILDAAGLTTGGPIVYGGCAW